MVIRVHETNLELAASARSLIISYSERRGGRVPTTVCLEPTIAAAHETLSISELSEKRRRWSFGPAP